MTRWAWLPKSCLLRSRSLKKFVKVASGSEICKGRPHKKPKHVRLSRERRVSFHSRFPASARGHFSLYSACWCRWLRLAWLVMGKKTIFLSFFHPPTPKTTHSRCDIERGSALKHRWWWYSTPMCGVCLATSACDRVRNDGQKSSYMCCVYLVVGGGGGWRSGLWSHHSGDTRRDACVYSAPFPSSSAFFSAVSGTLSPHPLLSLFSGSRVFVLGAGIEAFKWREGERGALRGKRRREPKKKCFESTSQ